MKRFLYLVFIFSLFFNTTLTYGQGWEKTFTDSTGLTKAFDVAQTSDGGYLLTGELDLVTGAIRHYIKVVKTDSEGNLQWEKQYQEFWAIANDEVAFIEPTADGNFMIGGLPYFIKISPEGDTLWRKQLTPNPYGGPISYNGISLESEDYILVTRGMYNNGTQNLAAPYISNISSQGEMIWEKNLTDSINHMTIYDVVENSNNELTMTGSNQNNIIVTKTNNFGEKLWRKEYDLTSTSTGTSITNTSDGGFLIGGYVIGISTQLPVLLKIDADGNTIWVKFPPDILNGGAITDIQQTSDGGYIATGSSTRQFWNVISNNGFVLKLDEDGENEWVEELNSGGSGSAIHEISDGVFIMAGSNPDGMLLKKIGGTNSSEHIFSDEIKLSVSPNPMNDLTSFKIDNIDSKNIQLRVFDSIGKLVRVEQFNSNEFIFYRKNLLSGLYFFELSSDGKLIGNGKLLLK